jgi:hypothetical protein
VYHPASLNKCKEAMLHISANAVVIQGLLDQVQYADIVIQSESSGIAKTAFARIHLFELRQYVINARLQ